MSIYWITFPLFLVFCVCFSDYAASGFLVFGSVFQYRSGMYHLMICQLSALILSTYMNKLATRYDIYFCIISTYLSMIFNLLFFNQKKYRIPVFLGFSKKSIVCGGGYFFDRLTLMKHWSIIIPRSVNGGSCYVLDCRGDIISDLKPNFAVVPLEVVKNQYVNFRRLGLTSKDILLNFVKRNQSKLTATYTCQMYTQHTSNYLLHPLYCSANVIRFRGRISFMLIILLVIAFLSLGMVKGIWIDIDLLIAGYVLIDNTKESFSLEYGRTRVSLSDMMISFLSFFVLWTGIFGLFSFRFYGVLSSCLAIATLISFLWIHNNVPSFSDATRIKG